MARLTSDEWSAINRAAKARCKADPAWLAAFRAKVSAAQKKRFARKDGKAHQKKMQVARWQGHAPLTAEQIRLANKMRSGGIRNPRHTLRQMMAAEQEQRT